MSPTHTVAPRSARCRAALFGLTMILWPALARAQYFELISERDSAHVGDIVTFRTRLHLGLQQRLTEPVPRPAQDLPEGIRIVSADTMRKQKDGAYDGAIQLAFYRTGTVIVPQFEVGLRIIGADVPTRLSHDPPRIEIVPLLPRGNPQLKDIRPLAPAGGRNVVPFMAAGALALAGLAWWRRSRRRAPPAPVMEAPAPPPPPTAYEVALTRLEALAGQPWPEEDVARYYHAVAEVLRAYFAAIAEPIEPGTTAGELARMLAGLEGSEPIRRRAVRVFGDADLVKFAAVRPDRATADAYLTEARAVLTSWDEQSSAPSTVDQAEDTGALR